MHLRIFVDLSGTAASTSQAVQLAWQRQRIGRVAFSVPRVSCRCAKLGEIEGATPPEATREMNARDMEFPLGFCLLPDFLAVSDCRREGF